MMKKKWLVLLSVLVVCISGIFVYKAIHVDTKNFGHVKLLQIDFNKKTIDEGQSDLVYERRFSFDEISEKSIVNYFYSRSKDRGTLFSMNLSKEELLEKLTSGEQLYVLYTSTDVMVKKNYSLTLFVEKKSDYYLYRIFENEEKN